MPPQAPPQPDPDHGPTDPPPRDDTTGPQDAQPPAGTNPPGTRQRPSETRTEPPTPLARASPIHTPVVTLFSPNAERCKAHTTDGNRCKNPARSGMTVCRMHGGSSPQAVAAARRRLAAASDLAAEALLEIAMDRKAPRGERLKALDSILDRGGAARRSELGIDADTVRSSLGERLDALDADAAESPADPQSPTVPAVGELGPGVTVDAVEDDAGRPDDAAGHSDGPDPG